ncbi:MAG: CBS domain-containing protein [Candidatus Omnitrophota bacterium]
MNVERVKDLMLPINEYPCASIDAVLTDAIRALYESQAKAASDREPYRAVLIVDHNQRVVGKIGQLGFLKALEPRFNLLGDRENLDKAGLGPEFLDWMIDNLRFWQEDFNLLCQRARSIGVEKIMQPVDEGIDADASLADAVHQFVMRQTLSLLVTSQGEIVGILRLSDLFHAAAETILKKSNGTE